MMALVSLVVCLSSTPAVCETITPDYVRQDTSRPPTFFECLGPSGQDIARKWLDENPGYLLRRVQCSIGNDPLACASRAGNFRGLSSLKKL